MPQIKALPDKSFLAEWPLFKFSICRLHDALTKRTKAEVHRSIADKLIDIKLHFSYLLTVNEHFLRGATLIVGNDELDKLNPNTISLLRGTHYRVYLLSVLIEQILDLLWFVLEGKAANFNKGKWKKIIDQVQAATGQSVITDADATLLQSFKEQFRTAEMHKFSMVRAMTGKDRWDHLQEEENAVARLLAKTHDYFVQA
jgi:hypothetical protein